MSAAVSGQGDGFAGSGPQALVRVLTGLLEPIGVGGNLIQDAHLAALAIEYGGEIHSADRDFERFAGVRYRNPLTE